MGNRLDNNAPHEAAKTKPMSSQLLWRHSRFNDGLGSVQPWEVWATYEDARRAWKKMSPGRARVAKRKATAARILGLWEIDRIEENGRLEEARAEENRRLEEQQASVSGSDISASEPPTTQYARIDRREDAVFDVLSMLPPEIQDKIWNLVYDPWEDFN